LLRGQCRGDGRDRDRRHRDRLHPREPLTEKQPARNPGDHRLQAEQHAEHLRAQPPHRGELEGIRHHGREDADQRQGKPGTGRAGQVPHARCAERQERDRTDRHRRGERSPAGNAPPDARPGEDVTRPERRGGPREEQTDRVERRAGATGLARPGAGHPQDHDRDGRDRHADEIARPAGEHRGEHERPAELHGDGDTERDARDRGVEEAVHPGQSQAEEHHRAPLAAIPPAHPRPMQREQQQGGDGEPHPRGQARPEPREQRDGDGGAELQRSAGTEDEEHCERAAGGGHDVHAPGRGIMCPANVSVLYW